MHSQFPLFRDLLSLFPGLAAALRCRVFDSFIGLSLTQQYSASLFYNEAPLPFNVRTPCSIAMPRPIHGFLSLL